MSLNRQAPFFVLEMIEKSGNYLRSPVSELEIETLPCSDHLGEDNDIKPLREARQTLLQGYRHFYPRVLVQMSHIPWTRQIRRVAWTERDGASS